MRNSTVNDIFIAAAKPTAAFAISTGEKKASFAALVLLLFFVLSSSSCIGLTGASKLTGSGSAQNPTGDAAFSVLPSSVDFGKVAVGGKVSQSITISNKGSSSLTVTKASATAAGVTLLDISLPLVIPAGKQSSFDVVFSPQSTGTLSGSVSVMSDLSSTPTTVALSGTATAASALLTTNSSGLNFGTVAVGKTGAMAVTLTNAGNGEVTISRVTISGASYSESGVSDGLILAPGQSVLLDATFAPQSAGSSNGSVTVASNAANSPATISLAGTGAQNTSQSVSHSVTLTWTPSSSPVAGYEVFRSQISGGPYAQLDSSVVVADSYVDGNVQAGQTYYYVVASVSATGAQSADSAQASATVPVQ